MKKKNVLYRGITFFITALVCMTVAGDIIFGGAAGYITDGLCGRVLADEYSDYDTREYTEEEKAQAKAWLSAHGYPPTREGANMAYQDYLNGKFDNDPEVQRYLGKEIKITDAVDDDTDYTSDSVKTDTVKPLVTTSGYVRVTTEAAVKVTSEVTTETTTEEAGNEDELMTENDSTAVNPDRNEDGSKGKVVGIIMIAMGLVAGVVIVILVRRQL